MKWSITYYNERVRKQVLTLPAGIVADYVRLTDAMAIHGADLRMPHSRAMGSGACSNCALKDPRALGVFFTAHRWAK